MSWTNYHSHTNFCDGKGTIQDYILAAVNKKMPSYGISSHNPIPAPAKWGMKNELVDTYIHEVSSLKKVFEDQIELYLGMEVDFFDHLEKAPSYLHNLDYWIGSIHFIDYLSNGDAWEIDGSTSTFERGLIEKYEGNIKPAIQRYFELMNTMVDTWQPPILGHLDKIKVHNSKSFFFDEGDPWYLNLVAEVLDTCKKHGTIIEVNTRGWYKSIVKEPYPSIPILRMIRKMDIPIMLNSDSHHISEITANFSLCAEILTSLGFKYTIAIKEGAFQAFRFNSEEGIVWRGK